MWTQPLSLQLWHSLTASFGNNALSRLLFLFALFPSFRVLSCRRACLLRLDGTIRFRVYSSWPNHHAIRRVLPGRCCCAFAISPFAVLVFPDSSALEFCLQWTDFAAIRGNVDIPSCPCIFLSEKWHARSGTNRALQRRRAWLFEKRG